MPYEKRERKKESVVVSNIYIKKRTAKLKRERKKKKMRHQFARSKRIAECAA
jgi:hypothetical protein